MNPSEPVRYPSLEGGIDAIFACLSFFHLNGNLGLVLQQANSCPSSQHTDHSSHSAPYPSPAMLGFQ